MLFRSCGATGLGNGIHTVKSVILPRLSDETVNGIYSIPDQMDPTWVETGDVSPSPENSPPTGRSLHIHDLEHSDLGSFSENELLMEASNAHILPDTTLRGNRISDIPTVPPSLSNPDAPRAIHSSSHASVKPPSEAEKEYLASSLGSSYEIVKKIGVGGMASVYLAREIPLDRLVAVKVLSQAYQTDDELVRRFKREARIAARLEHPNIVSIHRVGGDENMC